MQVIKPGLGLIKQKRFLLISKPPEGEGNITMHLSLRKRNWGHTGWAFLSSLALGGNAVRKSGILGEKIKA